MRRYWGSAMLGLCLACGAYAELEWTRGLLPRTNQASGNRDQNLWKRSPDLDYRHRD